MVALWATLPTLAPVLLAAIIVFIVSIKYQAAVSLRSVRSRRTSELLSVSIWTYSRPDTILLRLITSLCVCLHYRA